ncbi:MAG TPA: hypothetical protein VKR38_15440 [Usitatibacter sp.]|nr:hypothetical protein [Usitatibacter sp.]
MRLSHESARIRRAVLAAAWMLVAILLAWHVATVRDYLDLAGRLGLRGAAESPTPLRQVFPEFAADAQTWVRHSISLLEGDSLRLRHTDIDNAPDGREVHWNSAWAWTIAGAGRVQQALAGGALPNAVEKAALWIGPLALFVLVVLLSTWTARRAGVLAGTFLAAAMVLQERLFEGFFASYCDHHGLLTVSVLGLVLGAVMMGAGWWREGGDAQAGLLPASRAAVRSGAILSAASGALGVWVSAASVIPAIAITGLAGLAATGLLGRDATARGESFDGGAWILWGRVGAIASLAFYLLEYFPQYLGWRLEVNHPLYAAAWWGGGHLVADLGERMLRPPSQRMSRPGTLALPLVAVAAAPLAVAIFGARVMSLADPFLRQLHQLFIGEFVPLIERLRGMDAWHLYRAILVDALPIVAAIATIVRLRRATPVVLLAATFIAAALLEMAWWQSRWDLNASAGAVVLTMVLMAHWTQRRSPVVRWAIAGTLVLSLYVPGALNTFTVAPAAVAVGEVRRHDAQVVFARDMAAALRATQPAGDIVVLSSPVTSTPLGYYGRFRTLGTFYWENRAGLVAAASIWTSRSDSDAARLLLEHGVTHIALIRGEEFIWQYYVLLHPDLSRREFDATFGGRMLTGGALPSWLRPVAYAPAPDLARFGFTAVLYQVDRQALSR